MQQNKFEVVLLLALPASGKSEVRRYLRYVSDCEREKDFHMGPSLQLDDFPYVNLMRLIDEELKKLGQPALFFVAPDKSFRELKDWGMLMLMLNQDFDDLIKKPSLNVKSAAQYFFDIMEKSSQEVGIKPRLSKLPSNVYQTLLHNLEPECLRLLSYKQKNIAKNIEGKTIVIEFARGGADGSSMPLEDAHGYQYALPLLSEKILAKAVILYIWVTPEESRRKNHERANPNDAGSILHHGVPIDVMMNEYGCDDMEWLEKVSEKPGTITVSAHGKKFYLPVAKFDNRKDRTSFLRNNSKDWPKKDVKAMHDEMKAVCDKLFSLYQKTK